MRRRFTIRGLLWLTAMVALAVGWFDYYLPVSRLVTETQGKARG